MNDMTNEADYNIMSNKEYNERNERLLRSLNTLDGRDVIKLQLR